MKDNLGWFIGTVVGLLIAILVLPLVPILWLAAKLTD